MTIVEMDKNKVPISKMYLSMALPVVLSMVVTLIYNIADTWFVAATGNTNLIAGVSLCAPILTILMAFGNIYGQGGNSLISRLIGKGEEEEVGHVSAVCFYLAIVSGAAAGAVMLLFKTPFLYMLGAGSETIEYAAQYAVWMAAGAPFIVTSFIPTNLLRSEGLSKDAMISTAGGAILNIILDPIFIFGFGMGAGGAAVATVLGYVFSDVYAVLVVIRKSKLLSVNIKKASTDKNNIAQIFGVGIPAAITNIMQSVSVIFINHFLLPYGSERIAAMGVALKVTLVGQLVLVGLTFGALPLFGYYFGAERHDKFTELVNYCMKVVTGIAIIFTAVLLAAARPVISFFLDDAQLIATGTVMLRFQVLAIAGAGIVMLMTIVFQSMGRMKEMFVLSISRQGIIFLIVLAAASAIAGYRGVLAAQAISDVISAALALSMYGHWKKNRMTAKNGACSEKKNHISGRIRKNTL